MALGALDAHAHEDLGDVLAELQFVELGLVVVDGRIGDGATAGGEQVDDDAVDGHVGADAVGQPVVVEQRVLVERRGVVALVDAGADLQELGPLHDPELGELLALEEGLDQLGALVGAGVGEEGADLRGRRVEPDHVDGHAAHVFLVRAEAGRQDAELMQALVDGAVDVVELRGGRAGVDEVLRDDEHLRRHAEDVEPGEDEGRAALAGTDLAVLADLGDRVVVRHEEREVGDVAVGPVGVGRADGDLLRGVRAFEDGRLREDLDAGDLGDAGGVVLGPSGDPFQDGTVVGGIRLVELVARVGDGADGLLDQRAFLGDGEVDPAADHLAGQADVVAGGVHAEEREAETVLAARGAVATARVATAAEEDRHDVEAEGDRAILDAVLDGDGHPGRQAAEGRDDLGRAGVGDRAKHVAGERRHLRVGDFDVGESCDVARGGILEGREDDEPVGVAAGLEPHLGRENLEFLHRGELAEQLGLGVLNALLATRDERDARRPRSSGRHPAAQEGELGRGQRPALRGHQVLVILRQEDALHELAAVGLAGLDDRAVGPALEEGGLRVHQQLTLHLVGVVAFDAARLQHRAHLLEGHGLGGREKR